MAATTRPRIARACFLALLTAAVTVGASIDVDARQAPMPHALLTAKQVYMVIGVTRVPAWSIRGSTRASGAARRR